MNAPGAIERRLAVTGGGAVAALALAKLALHLATTGRWGYEFFIDELYFLDCSRHLAWGYVDIPPLFPALTAGIRALLGESLLAVRLLPALAGAATLLLTGALARELGGKGRAAAIAALALLAAPLYLVLNSIHTVNELEPLLWTGCALVLARIANGASPRLWLAFGLLCGIGLLNKHTMAMFGLAAFGALLATPWRRHLRERRIWLGGLLAFAVFLPNLVWMVRHHFPHLEMLANIRRDGRDVGLSPLAFVAQQVALMNPVAAPLWIGGLAWLLFARDGRRFRILGLVYLGILLELLVLNGRVYYLAPAYPILLASGGVALEKLAEGRRLLVPASAALLAVSGTVLAPLSFPCVPPETYVRYSAALGIEPPRIENHRMGPLPQLLADRFGWKEMAEVTAAVYRRLPPEERAKAAIFGQLYGQAGAVNHYGPELGIPRAISGHLTHWYWGPQGATGEVLIVMDDRRERLLELFESVELGGRVEHPYSMPYEHFDVWVCRRMKDRRTLESLWPQLKRWN